jgi:hypothetical protein
MIKEVSSGGWTDVFNLASVEMELDFNKGFNKSKSSCTDRTQAESICKLHHQWPSVTGGPTAATMPAPGPCLQLGYQKVCAGHPFKICYEDISCHSAEGSLQSPSPLSEHESRMVSLIII